MSGPRQPLRIVLGEDPYDVKIYLGERDLIAEGLALSEIEFRLDHSGRRVLTLESEMFEFEGTVSEFNIRCRKVIEELKPHAQSYEETEEKRS